MIQVSRDELAELHEQAVDASLVLALAGGVVRYLARAAEEVVTDDLSSVLELISIPLCCHEAADKMSDRLSYFVREQFDRKSADAHQRTIP